MGPSDGSRDHGGAARLTAARAHAASGAKAGQQASVRDGIGAHEKPLRGCGGLLRPGAVAPQPSTVVEEHLQSP